MRYCCVIGWLCRPAKAEFYFNGSYRAHLTVTSSDENSFELQVVTTIRTREFSILKMFVPFERNDMERFIRFIFNNIISEIYEITGNNSKLESETIRFVTPLEYLEFIIPPFSSGNYTRQTVKPE